MKQAIKQAESIVIAPGVHTLQQGVQNVKRSITMAALISSVFASVNAHAGGLSDGTVAVTNFEVWFYALAGVAALAYLVWVGVQCWSNKADWISDFGGAVAKVAAVGSVTVLGPWAWSVFSA